MFGGWVQDYSLVSSMYEFDITDIIHSQELNPSEEVKEMSISPEFRNWRDISMEKEDEESTLFKIATQKEMSNGSILWRIDSHKISVRYIELCILVINSMI